MAYTWIKLYLSIIDNEEVGMLTDRVFKRFIQFMCIAREYNHDGLLKPVHLLAWRLRTSEEDILESLRTMRECGLVAETPDGWLVVNFAREQAPMDVAERVRQSRQRKQALKEDVTDRYQECNEEDNEVDNAAAADPSASASASDSISISDSDSESTSDSESESESESKFDSEFDSDSERDEVAADKSTVITAYEKNIGRVTPLIDRSLREMEREYSPPWVTAAIQEAVRSNGRSLSYVDAILQRWKRDGFKSGKKPPRKRHEMRGADVKRLVDEFMQR